MVSIIQQPPTYEEWQGLQLLAKTSGALNVAPSIAAIHKMTERLHAEYLKNPLAREFAREAALAPDPKEFKINTVKRVLGERQILMLQLCEAALGTQDVHYATALLSVALKAGVAVPFLVASEIIKTVVDNPPPAHIVPSMLLPYPLTWITTPVDGHFLAADGKTEAMALLLEHGIGRGTHPAFPDEPPIPPGIMVHQILNGPPYLSGNVIAYGSPYEPELPVNVRGGMLGILHVLSDPKAVMVMEHKMPRHERRAIGSADQTGVRFVTVRYANEKYEGNSPEPRDWRIRWFVRGHWRRQWHPSTHGHQLRWINPYLKGPEGAPLKPSIYAMPPQ